MPFMAAVIRKLAAGMGEIERHRAPVSEVFPGTDGNRGIARCQLRTAIQRIPLRKTGNQRALRKERRILLAVAASVVPRHQIVFPAPFTLQ